MCIMRQDFGKYITELRRKNNLSQVALAEKLDLTQSQVCNIEKGVYFPSVDTLVKLSLLYDVTLDEMLDIKRKNVVTFHLGNRDSEMRMFSILDQYHKKSTEDGAFFAQVDNYYERFSSMELFKYGKTICEENISLIESLHKKYTSKNKNKDKVRQKVIPPDIR